MLTTSYPCTVQKFSLLADGSPRPQNLPCVRRWDGAHPPNVVSAATSFDLQDGGVRPDKCVQGWRATAYLARPRSPSAHLGHRGT